MASEVSMLREVEITSSRPRQLRAERREPSAYDSVRTPRDGLVHRDRRGLEHLMNDYLALGDELESIEPRRDTIAAPPPAHAIQRPRAA